MSTGNFHKQNSMKYYVFSDEYADAFNNFEELQEDLRELIKERFEKLPERNISFSALDEESEYSLKSYPRHNVLGITKKYADMIITVCINTNAGYYTGFNLDYDIELERVRSDGFIDGGVTLRELNKKEDARLERFRLVVENVLRNVAEQTLNIKAVFSNGETLYSVAE